MSDSTSPGERGISEAVSAPSRASDGATNEPVEAPLAPRDLMMRFESIGESCEFGLVQRRCGAEPLGLFRFASAPLAKLLAALGADFAGFGEPGALEVELSASGREYMIKDKRFGLLYHAWVLAGEMTPEEIHQREIRRLPFLIRKLKEDLAGAEKIFVYHGMGRLGDADATPVVTALRRYGPNTLLWVELATSNHPAGTVERAGTGLLRGYIDRFAPGENAHDFSLDCWIAICREAYRLWTSESAIREAGLGTMASIKASVDAITRRRVAGWVLDTDRPDETFSVVINVNDRELGRCAANDDSENLQELFGAANHAFSFDFDPPLSVFQEFTIEITVVGQAGEVARAVKTLPKPIVDKTPGQLVPIILTSTGRTGTTLLMREFGRRPEIVVAGEYPFEMKMISYYAAAFRALTANEDRENSTNPDHMFANENRTIIGHNPYNAPGHHSFIRNRPAVEEFFGTAIPSKLATLFRDVILEYYDIAKRDLGKNDAVFFAEKGVLDSVPREAVRLFFGDVRELVIVRDPRDLMCSAMAFWKYSAGDAVQRLLSALPQLEAIHNEESHDIFFLRYEDLIMDPVAARRDIYQFLGIEPDRVHSLTTDMDLFDAHGTSRDPAASIGRWRSDLKADEVAACEAAFGSFMQRFGYADDPMPARHVSMAGAKLGGPGIPDPHPGSLHREKRRAEDAVILEIAFGLTGNSNDYLREGWSNPETGFTWTGGIESRLELPRPADPDDYCLELRVRPFVWRDQLPSQRLTVMVNDIPVGTATASEFSVLKFPIDWELLAAKPRINIRFSLPDAARPSEVRGTTDKRCLAFSFEKLRLLRVGEDTRSMVAR